MPVAVPVRVPDTVTDCPMYSPAVDAQDICPAVPVTDTERKFGASRTDETATELRFGAARVDETTVVLAGMPVPEIDCPAPIRALTDDKAMVVELLRITDSVNTPTFDMVVPLTSP